MKIKLIGSAILFLVMMACTQADNLAEERARRADKSTGDIIIGAAAPWSELQDGLWDGIEFAVKEINSSGGVLGRKIQVIKKDDKAAVSAGQIVAQQFAENKDIIAVIGHYNSYVSIPASVIYEYYGLIMLSPSSTSPKLTQQGFKLVFRNIPSDAVFGSELADFCAKRGYKNMMIYHSNNEYGQGLANAFEMQAEQTGIAILDRIDYDSLSGSRTFRKDLLYWKENFHFDAIFLAGVTPQVALFLIEARKLGIMVPIIGSDGLDTPELVDIAGESAENTFVGSVFHTEIPIEKARNFIRKFSEIYKVNPDSSAAQGYDTVYLLAYAIEKANSTVPRKLADELHALKKWEGVTGSHTFAQNGDIVDMDISIKIVKNGRFEYVTSQ
ncbi:MAG: ABC transporter substrate-binding protein [Proteobacteria bacterium]|nr:ABC transporter substrate-binding protein [Pseudomonadota bacterium]